jgi:hypothetical protein
MASEFIKPAVPLIPGYTKLPPLDQVEARLLIPPILVFRVDSPEAQDSIVQDLQDGLAKTIEELPFIAADVIPESAERGTIQLDIQEDAGVWFYVRELPDLDFDVLERRRFAPSCFSILDLVPEPRQHNWDRSPVLTVQATFITGGLLLVNITCTFIRHADILITRQVFNAHHSVMDGRGMIILGETWAKNVGAVSEGRLVSETLKQEKIDRTQVFGNGSRNMALCDFPNYRLTKQTWRFAMQQELWEAAVTGNSSHPKLQILHQLHLSFWSISQTSMRAMRQAASPTSSNAAVLTDSTVLAAVLWRHITRARQLSSQGVEKTCLQNVVNVRRRLEPPLSLDYPGNALAHAKTAAKTADVESERPLYELARQVSDSIDWWTSDRIWGLIGAIDSTPHVGKV